MTKPDLRRLIDFQQLLLDFRAIDRKLHIPPGLEKYENDTEHSYALAMTAWFLAAHFPHLDRDLVIRMALAHDLIEVHAGDTYSYSDKQVLEQKTAREEAALAQLQNEWPDFPELLDTIRSYETRDTEEAKFVYALDKLTPALVDYMNEGHGWHDNGITFAMFCEEKNKKVPISPEINDYCQTLIGILEKEQHLFPQGH
jgi:putative hydrolase of HD superfamily